MTATEEKSAIPSTEEKIANTEASTEEPKNKLSVKGKEMIPTESNAQWQFPKQRLNKTPSLGPILTSPAYAQTAKNPRPEDNSILKPWYNKSLQKLNPQIYESFCHLHTFAQRTQLRPIDFHLSNLEKLLLKEIELRDRKIFQYEEQLNDQLQGYQRARESANNMISYCKLETSPYWENQLQDLPNLTIRSIIENFQLADLIKIRIKDFGLFLDAFRSKDHLLQRIKKEEKIHELLTLYKQNLIPAETVLELLRSLSSDVYYCQQSRRSSLTPMTTHIVVNKDEADANVYHLNKDDAFLPL